MQPQELIHGHRQHAKHHLRHGLLGASHTDLAAQEFG
jgi:hypothetical protein